MDSSTEKLIERADAEMMPAWEQAVETRRRIHMHPETGFDTRETEALVRSRLEAAGIEILPSSIGVLARIPGRDRSCMTALRADMDALPIQEENDVPYCSRVPGRMHACGHDGHTAMLLSAADILSRNRSLLPRDVLLIFQPAEEGPDLGGARVMLKDMEEQGTAQKVRRIYGLHLFNDFPCGEIRWRAGSLFASTDEFDIRIRGRGGHAGQPQRTADALSAGAKVVSAMESFMSRQVDPLDSAVFSVGMFHAGSARNVVAETARLEGTIRCQREETRAHVLTGMERVVNGICAACGVSADIGVLHGLPVLVNDGETTRLAVQAAVSLAGPDRVRELDSPMMGAEDFTYFARALPASFLLLGSGSAEKGFTSVNHQPRFDFDEEAMQTGIRLLCRLAAADV